MTIEKNTIILILSLILLVVLLLLFFKYRAKKKAHIKLDKDPSGLWKYHKETQYLRKSAYSRKLNKKEKKEKNSQQKPVAVLEFDGDIRAKNYQIFSKLVDEIVVNKDELSSVVIIVTSPGGVVPTYGQVYSQMERIRNIGLTSTACIDVVAASGGYLMSVPADKIVASPFSFVGSVGVMAFVPNFREFLEKASIKPRTFTSGKFKRTVTLTDDATEEEVQRFQNQLDEIHSLFLQAVKKYRPNAKMEEIETGSHWTAQRSMELDLGLVDELGNSSDYLLELNQKKDLVFVSQKKSLFQDGIPFLMQSFFDAFFNASKKLFVWGK